MNWDTSGGRHSPTTTGRLQPLLVGIPDACGALGLGRSTVYELIAKGDLEARKVGRRRLVTADSLKRLAESGS